MPRRKTRSCASRHVASHDSRAVRRPLSASARCASLHPTHQWCRDGVQRDDRRDPVGDAELRHLARPDRIIGNIVYAGGADGVLRAINATSGALVWKGSAGAPMRTAPTISGGHVYVATDNGRLVAFNASGCGKATCAPTAIGNAALPTRRPRVRH